MAEELIYKVGVEGTNELNKLEQKVTDTGKATNKTTDYFQKMRMELRAARGDMLKYAAGTQEHNRALNKAADIQGRMKAVNDKVRASTQDLGDTAKHVTGAMVGFAGGFQVVQSAMSLFGIENEETIKTVLKLQQTMSLVQGLSAFAQGIDNMQDIIAAFRASNHQLNEELKTTSDGMEGVSKSTGKMGDSMGATVKDSAVLGSNLAGNTKIADDLDKGLGKVSKNIGELTVNMDKIDAGSIHFANLRISLLEGDKALLQAGASTKNLSKNTQELLEANNATNAGIKEKIALIDVEIQRNEQLILQRKKQRRTEQLSEGKSRELFKKTTEATEEGTKATEEGTKATNLFTKAKEKFGKSSKKAGKGISSFTKSILKSLGTMAVFLAAIWAVTAGISWLVKKLSEVPEDVKIKLELETNALNSYIASLNKIKNFVREYNQALKDGNENYLKQLDKTAIKEFNKNQADLDAIKKRGKMTEDFFTGYLQMAKDTYFNEALAKLKSEKEVALEIAKEEEKSAQKLKDQRKEENKGESGFVTLGRWIFTKDQVKKARKEGEKIQKELDALAKIEYKPVKSPFIEDEIITPPPTVKTAPGDAPTLQERKPDEAGDELEIKLMGERLLAKRGLSNEERELEAENARFTDENQSDSYLRYAEHQQRMAIARDKDLGDRKNALEESLAKEEEFYQTQLANQNENLKAVADGHNAELEKLKQFNQIKFDIEEEVSALIKQRQGLDAKTDADEIARIDAKIMAKKKLYDENDALIEQSKKEIQTYKDRAKAIEEELKALDATPERIKLLKDELVDLNLAITESNRAVAMSIAEVRNAQLDSAREYTEQMGMIFFDLQNITNAMMQAEDNKLAKEKNNLELSQAYRQADSEQQQQMMYELELANYEAKKKAFEVDKAFQIGAVVTQSASNQIDIIKAWLDPKTGGPLSPANIAVAAAATAANVATTVASIKQISSTSLEKPIPPGGAGGGAGGGGANIALNPNKTALTSKEENLNSMYKSGNIDDKDTIVKVSEINNVQKRVKVREKNSSY